MKESNRKVWGRVCWGVCYVLFSAYCLYSAVTYEPQPPPRPNDTGMVHGVRYGEA